MSLKDLFEELDLLSALPYPEGKFFNLICFCKVHHGKKVQEYICTYVYTYTPDHINRYTPEFLIYKWFFGTLSVDNFLIFCFLLSTSGDTVTKS